MSASRIAYGADLSWIYPQYAYTLAQPACGQLHILERRVPLRGGFPSRETIIYRHHVESRHGGQLSIVIRIGEFIASLPRTAMDKHDDRIDAPIEQIQISRLLRCRSYL